MAPAGLSCHTRYPRPSSDSSHCNSLQGRLTGPDACLPRILVSDGLGVFGPAARTVFAGRSGLRFVHVTEIHMKKIFNQNNICERLNGEFKDGLSRIRGLKAEMPPIVRLMIVYHNFFRTHTGIGGRTPAMEAGIDIISGNGGDADSVPDEDTWITFIQNAALCTA